MSKTFLEKFGKNPDQMDDGEWRVAVASLFSGVNDRLDIVNGKVGEVSKNKAKITKMWIIGGLYGMFILGLLIWLTNAFLRHCGV